MKQLKDLLTNFAIIEAEYQGKQVQLNKPFRTPGGPKKFSVYVKNSKGNVVKVNFGDSTGLSIKRDQPERRAAFRARHNCATATDRTSPRYWSCKMWQANKSVGQMLENAEVEITIDDYMLYESDDQFLMSWFLGEKEVWDSPNPNKNSKKLTPSKKSAARARARAAGRPYPNMVDNIWAARKK